MKKMGVDFNELTSLPASLANAQHLVILYASFNRLSAIPDEVFQHPGIVYLDASTNNLTQLPYILMEM